VHIKSITAEPSADCERIAEITTGFTGADLANLINEATIVATRRGAQEQPVATRRTPGGRLSRNRHQGFSMKPTVAPRRCLRGGGLIWMPAPNSCWKKKH
jgi:SpoVK/Ycf46/Vps4 family AAA+-type ATPase